MISSFVLLLAISAAFGFGIMYFLNPRWGTALALLSLLCAAAFFGATTDWTVVKGAVFAVLLYGSSIAGASLRNAVDARSDARQARATTEEAVFDAHHS